MVDRFGATEFLAFLENPNPGETEFLGFFGVFVLCCVVAAQIGGGAVLSWPRSVVVLCCCEAQIGGSHTSLYLTLTLFLSKVDLEVFSLGFLWI